MADHFPHLWKTIRNCRVPGVLHQLTCWKICSCSMLSRNACMDCEGRDWTNASRSNVMGSSVRNLRASRYPPRERKTKQKQNMIERESKRQAKGINKRDKSLVVALMAECLSSMIALSLTRNQLSHTNNGMIALTRKQLSHINSSMIDSSYQKPTFSHQQVYKLIWHGILPPPPTLHTHSVKCTLIHKQTNI